MKTSVTVTAEFEAELQALLNKWGANISADDHYQGYPECGEDIRMQVEIPAIYDADHNCVREWTQIDLGQYVFCRSSEQP